MRMYTIVFLDKDGEEIDMNSWDDSRYDFSHSALYLNKREGWGPPVIDIDISQLPEGTTMIRVCPS